MTSILRFKKLEKHPFHLINDKASSYSVKAD